MNNFVNEYHIKWIPRTVWLRWLQGHRNMQNCQMVRQTFTALKFRNNQTFSLIRVLQASFLLGRWSRVPATGTPVAGAGGLLSKGCRFCCLGAMSSSSLSYSSGLFAALTRRANKKIKACNNTIIHCKQATKKLLDITHTHTNREREWERVQNKIYETPSPNSVLTNWSQSWP
jgi:hypothetical protein